jgi:hypothetical protein
MNEQNFTTTPIQDYQRGFIFFHLINRLNDLYLLKDKLKKDFFTLPLKTLLEIIRY